MKTQKEIEELKKKILSMTKEELIIEKWKGYTSENINCSHCSHCSHCSYCRFQIWKKYMIANVQFTKEEYEDWLKKIKEKK